MPLVAPVTVELTTEQAIGVLRAYLYLGHRVAGAGFGPSLSQWLEAVEALTDELTATFVVGWAQVVAVLADWLLEAVTVDGVAPALLEELRAPAKTRELRALRAGVRARVRVLPPAA